MQELTREQQQLLVELWLEWSAGQQAQNRLYMIFHDEVVRAQPSMAHLHLVDTLSVLSAATFGSHQSVSAGSPLVVTCIPATPAAASHAKNESCRKKSRPEGAGFFSWIG